MRGVALTCGLAIVWAGLSAPAAPATGVKTYANCVGPKFFYRSVKPRRCTFRPYVGGDAQADANTARIVGLRWHAWSASARRTRGTGIYVPASGDRSSAVVTLSRPRRCRDDRRLDRTIRVYERFVVRAAGDVIAEGRSYYCAF